MNEPSKKGTHLWIKLNNLNVQFNQFFLKYNIIYLIFNSTETLKIIIIYIVTFI